VTTAVLVKCPEHHKVAEISPFPAAGVMTAVEAVRCAARYQAGLAQYITGEQRGEHKWVTVSEKRARLSEAEFRDPQRWLDNFSATWACRCGTGTLHVNDVITAFYLWCSERSRTGKTTPRTVFLQRSR
jgi:hypothetical protein